MEANMGEKTVDSQRKIRSIGLVQPVTRFVAAMVLTVVNGRLELRPESPSAPHALTSLSLHSR